MWHQIIKGMLHFRMRILNDPDMLDDRVFDDEPRSRVNFDNRCLTASQQSRFPGSNLNDDRINTNKMGLIDH